MVGLVNATTPHPDRANGGCGAGSAGTFVLRLRNSALVPRCSLGSEQTFAVGWLDVVYCVTNMRLVSRLGEEVGGQNMPTANLPAIRACRPAWNKGRLIGQKRPLLPKHVWAIRVRLEIAGNHRDLALFNLAVDSKLRGCDLVKLKVVDVYASGQVKERTSIIQSKTQRPVRFEITEGTRKTLPRWMEEPLMVGSEFLWPGRFHERLHISTRQYARLVRDWVCSAAWKLDRLKLEFSATLSWLG